MDIGTDIVSPAKHPFRFTFTVYSKKLVVLPLSNLDYLTKERVKTECATPRVFTALPKEQEYYSYDTPIITLP